MLSILEANSQSPQFKKELYGKPLQSKTAIPVLAPTRLGKTTTSNFVVKRFHRRGFGHIGSTMTRPRRDDDLDVYKTADEGITISTFYDAAARGELVNYSPYGTNVYGTFAQDFHGKYPIGPIVSDSLEALDGAGFENVRPVFLVARHAIYAPRLIETGIGMKGIEQRLANDRESIEFARQNRKNDWINFIEVGEGPASLKKASKLIVRLATQNVHSMMDPEEANDFLDEMSQAITDAEDLLKVQ